MVSEYEQKFRCTKNIGGLVLYLAPCFDKMGHPLINFAGTFTKQTSSIQASPLWLRSTGVLACLESLHCL